MEMICIKQHFGAGGLVTKGTKKTAPKGAKPDGVYWVDADKALETVVGSGGGEGGDSDAPKTDGKEPNARDLAAEAKASSDTARLVELLGDERKTVSEAARARLLEVVAETTDADALMPLFEVDDQAVTEAAGARISTLGNE